MVQGVPGLKPTLYVVASTTAQSTQRPERRFPCVPCLPWLKFRGGSRCSQAFLTPQTTTVASALAQATDAPLHPQNTAFFHRRKSAFTPQPTLMPRVILARPNSKKHGSTQNHVSTCKLLCHRSSQRVVHAVRRRPRKHGFRRQFFFVRSVCMARGRTKHAET